MKRTSQTLLKSLFVGLAYLIAIFLSGVILRAIGLRLPETKDALGKLALAFAAGEIAGLSLGNIAAFLPASKTRHRIIWTGVIFLNLASVAVEGYFFMPKIIGNTLPGLLIQQFIAALAASWVITALFAPKEPVKRVATAHRSAVSWLWRFPASALTYVVFYFVFGMLNYLLVTRPYYQTHAGGLTVPALAVTLTAEILRGVLIALSVLSFILTTRINKRGAALQTSFILFVIGGLVPLTLQIGLLPLLLLIASAVEIFFQNFSTGLVISRLMSLED